MNIQEKMFLELKDKELFRRAGDYALEYAEAALDRNVFPDEKAITNLVSFEEVMPVDSSDAAAILDQLHKYGSPAVCRRV